MVQTRSEYTVVYADGVQHKATAQNIRILVNELDTPGNPINSVQLTRAGVQAIEVDPIVYRTFTVEVSPGGAGPAGCVALPSGATVADGTEVILEAVPAVGYDFVGWYNGATLLSEELQFVYTVGANVTITATFEVQST